MIAYVTEDLIVNIVPFEKLTHINYAFLIPNEDGTLKPIANAWKLKELAQAAHKNNVKVLISVGGWGWDAQFESLAADPARRKVFVDGCVAFIHEHQFDGIDIDWEYPRPGESAQNYVALMRELRAAMPEGSLLTTAVPAFGANADNILAEAFDVLDFANIMAYDMDQQDHSNLPDTLKSLDYWAARGLPPEKTVLGVPFYSRPRWISYRKLIAADPAAAQQDQIEYQGGLEYYNGIPTIQEKTRLAMQRVSGVMFWTLQLDTLDDETSLLSVIDSVIHPTK